MFTARTGMFELDMLSGFGFVAECGPGRPGELVLATRGTNFGYNMHDVATDINCGYSIGPGNHVVHRGFNKTFASYQHDLYNFVFDHGRRADITTVHCVGHSLGGAVANLNAMALKDMGFAVMLYTVGSPRVGWHSFAAELTNKLNSEQIFRVVNPGDPVPMVPVFPFMHASEVGSEYVVNTNEVVGIGCHMLGNGYQPMQRADCWSALRPLHPMDEVNSENFGSVIQSHMGPSLHSSSLLRKIGLALTHLLKVTGVAVSSYRQFVVGLGFTVVDMLMEALTRAVNGPEVLVEEAKSVVHAMLKFLGRPLTWIAEITLDLIRHVVHSFAGEMSNRAQLALAQASKVS